MFHCLYSFSILCFAVYTLFVFDENNFVTNQFRMYLYNLLGVGNLKYC